MDSRPYDDFIQPERPNTDVAAPAAEAASGVEAALAPTTAEARADIAEPDDLHDAIAELELELANMLTPELDAMDLGEPAAVAPAPAGSQTMFEDAAADLAPASDVAPDRHPVEAAMVFEPEAAHEPFGAPSFTAYEIQSLDTAPLPEADALELEMALDAMAADMFDAASDETVDTVFPHAEPEMAAVTQPEPASELVETAVQTSTDATPAAVAEVLAEAVVTMDAAPEPDAAAPMLDAAGPDEAEFGAAFEAVEPGEADQAARIVEIVATQPTAAIAVDPSAPETMAEDIGVEFVASETPAVMATAYPQAEPAVDQAPADDILLAEETADDAMPEGAASDIILADTIVVPTAGSAGDAGPDMPFAAATFEEALDAQDILATGFEAAVRSAADRSRARFLFQMPVHTVHDCQRVAAVNLAGDDAPKTVLVLLGADGRSCRMEDARDSDNPFAGMAVSYGGLLAHLKSLPSRAVA